ncbi:MAG: hypothetical protein O2897_06485 [bacterium]|nr:hypothetical protein [bacterium]
MINSRCVVKILYCFLLLICVINFSGCSKCKELADLICDCQEDVVSVDNCRKTASMRAGNRGFPWIHSESICEEVINRVGNEDDLCNCQAIIRQEYEKCGMTRQAKP